jgi:hypothetical protein
MAPSVSLLKGYAHSAEATLEHAGQRQARKAHGAQEHGLESVLADVGAEPLQNARNLKCTTRRVSHRPCDKSLTKA